MKANKAKTLFPEVNLQNRAANYHRTAAHAFDSLFSSYLSNGRFDDYKHYGESGTRRTTSEGFWKYIPFSMYNFLEYLTWAEELHRHVCLKGEKDGWYERPRFLDVGCGIGDKVFVANRMGDSAFGLEYQDFLVKKAHDMLPKLGVNDAKTNIFKANAMEFDGYGEFDIIYFYRPIENSEKQWTLEAQVFNQAKINTVVCPVYLPIVFNGAEWMKDYGWEKVGQIFVRTSKPSKKLTLNYTEWRESQNQKKSLTTQNQSATIRA